jgi:hypothetical protein
MVGQDVRERRDVVQQRLDRAVGQGVEGRVGGREDGERAGACQRVDEARGLNGGDQRREFGRGGGKLDDVAGAGERKRRVASASGAAGERCCAGDETDGDPWW